MGFSSQLQSGSRGLGALGHWLVARSERGIEARVINALSRRLPDLMRECGVPGVQCAIGVGSRPTHSFAHGIAAVDAKTPLTSTTRFLTASLSKPVTGLVCLELASQGKLQLDRAIGECVESRWAESMHPGLSELSIRQLLTHGAKIPYSDSSMHGVEQASDQSLRTLEFEQTTPEQWATKEQSAEHSQTYTGRGYAILQRVIERHLGKPFDQVASTALTDPLCANCTFSINAACQFDLARDHDISGNQLPQLWTPSLAASGLVCSAAGLVDAVRYALRERRRPFMNDLFVRPSGAVAPYTCGFHIWKDIDSRVLDHGAARPGMRGVIKVIPDANMVFVMLANSAHGVKVFRTFVGLVEQLGLARL